MSPQSRPCLYTYAAILSLLTTAPPRLFLCRHITQPITTAITRMRGTKTAATVVYTWSLGGADPIPVIKGRAVYWQQKHDKFVFPTSLQRSLTTQMFVLCKCVYVYIISSVQDVSTISTSYSSRTRTSFDLFLWNQIAISIYSGSTGGHAITQGIAPRTFSIHGVTSLVLWARPTFLGAWDPEISPRTCLKI